MQKYILVVLFLILTSCRSNHKANPPIDPWHGSYMHVSEKFKLILDHFSEESISVDIYKQSQKRPRNSFFADIKKDMGIFQDRTESNCRVVLKNTNEGIVVSDQCNGTGEIDGLYKRIWDVKP